jgi:hypothetical protein
MYPGTRPVDTFDSSFLPQPVILTPILLRRQIWPRLLRDPQNRVPPTRKRVPPASSTYWTVRLRGPTRNGCPRAPCIHSHLHPLARIRCEKFGLADSSATIRGQIDP